MSETKTKMIMKIKMQQITNWDTRIGELWCANKGHNFEGTGRTLWSVLVPSNADCNWPWMVNLYAILFNNYTHDIIARTTTPPLGARELFPPPRKKSAWRHGQSGESCLPPEKERMTTISVILKNQSPACPWRHTLFFRGVHNSFQTFHDVMRSFYGGCTTF